MVHRISYLPFVLSNLNANWTFIPAYSIEEYSASILVKENSTDRLPPGIKYSKMHYVRMVRNEDTGECCCVTTDCHPGFIDLFMILWDSSEHRHRCLMRFRKDIMLRSVFGDGPINPEDIARGAFLFLHINEHRMCSKCNPLRFRGRLRLSKPVRSATAWIRYGRRHVRAEHARACWKFFWKVYAYRVLQSRLPTV